MIRWVLKSRLIVGRTSLGLIAWGSSAHRNDPNEDSWAIPKITLEFQKLGDIKIYNPHSNEDSDHFGPLEFQKLGDIKIYNPHSNEDSSFGNSKVGGHQDL
uniref:Peptidase S1 domain-containing protein n=1 Tax=Panagrellus redivivus TaxID=6233 RepID=A0A7E4URL7_PANRE